MQVGYDIDELYQEAQTRWLKPAEVLFILQNHEKYQFTQEPPQQPTSGSLFLFNKRVLRFFRRDGHNWRKKKDGRTVGEAHERLKVGNVETVNCYYAHGEQNPNFQRRSYWKLDPAYEHIVLVHYRDITEGKPSSGSNLQLSPAESSPFSQGASLTSQNPGSASNLSDFYETYPNFSSPGSVEVTSNVVIKDDGMDCLDKKVGGMEAENQSEIEVCQALRRLEEQLSLNEDSFQEIASFCCEHENSLVSNILESYREIGKQDRHNYCHQTDNHSQFYGEHIRGEISEPHHQILDHDYANCNQKTLSWEEVLDSCKTSSMVESPVKHGYTEKSFASLRSQPTRNQGDSIWMNLSKTNANNSSLLPCQEVEDVKFSANFSSAKTQQTNSDYHSMLFEGQIAMPVDTGLNLTVARNQKFTIKEVSPEWGYATETTKVIIIGSFLCDPSVSSWTCMFGDVEVPLQIIQEGVIRCEAPPHLPEKVSLCITSGNRESCSEVREFEYRDKTGSYAQCNSSQTEATKSPEELLLLVRFVQMLLSDSSTKNDSMESGINPLQIQKADDDSWSHVLEALLVGSGSSYSTTNWLLEELLKDKLLQWISCRSQESREETGCSLSKKEQVIIHMVAGLGFEWALNPILSCGVSINFRDINGWTALHWAARFGREKMVASLIASGASAGAVTDPNKQDPTGKTAASIAASSGHKGLAGYLSEVALTSHLSSLTLEESELSRGSAEVEAEIAVNSISNGSITASEDHLSLKDTLAAVRNAAQAAARIQSAFRAHSFRKRQQREAAATGIDGYVINADSIANFPGLSALSKITFGSPRDNSAALSIQKNYRGWKGRKDFLALRKKVVKIQAHVRGYQVRKQYRVICWAVGILEKVVLRWRRKGSGLRGFRPETEFIDESEDDDILKSFRKQKVDIALDEAVSRVLSMVNSPDARLQYHRMLEKYQQAKAELGIKTPEAEISTSIDDASCMVDDDIYKFLLGTPSGHP